MTRPDRDAASSGTQTGSLVLYDRPIIRPRWKTGPRVAKLRRMADAMRAITGTEEAAAHKQNFTWNAGRRDMLTLRRYDATVSNDAVLFELRTDVERAGRNSLLLGIIAPEKKDRILPATNAIVELAGYADALADRLVDDDPISTDTWKTIVRDVVLKRIEDAGCIMPRTFHLARSPLHDERICASHPDPNGRDGEMTYVSVACDSGLPACMHGTIDDRTFVPMLISAITEQNRRIANDPVATLRGLARIAAATGWTPPTITPDGPAQGGDA